MWSDNETDKDFLNFSGISNTVAEIIERSGDKPTSIGVSGAWGVGKSSMIKLIRAALQERSETNGVNFVFVEFNAWLYQGYDDARAALLESIATSLVETAPQEGAGLEKARELLGRVNWLRLAQLTASSLIPMAIGLPPLGVINEAIGVGRQLFNNQTSGQQGSDEQGGSSGQDGNGSPPQQIQAIRESFRQTLSELDVKLVVLIDDLDRCLPSTAISTLEAIRLFLFIENTAFVIAADESMIKHAVRTHFDGVDDAVATNYFDKLIQVPIRVPPLGTQEVRAYMMLLYVENSDLDLEEKETIRERVCTRLAESWRGLRVDRSFMQSIFEDLPNDLIGQFDTADRLAPLMATTSQIGGNPRLIKRFLNALSIRMAISRAHGVGVDEAVLAKMLLFERCASPAVYGELTKEVSQNHEGKPEFLGDWEQSALAGDTFDFDSRDNWDDPFIHEWLQVQPNLAEIDLRGVLYVSREHAPIVTAEDRLSSEGAELLTAILEFPGTSSGLHDRLAALPRLETTIIMDKILERSRNEQEWGSPPILDGALVVADADPIQGQRLASFLKERPVVQIRPSIVPKISDRSWSGEVFDHWNETRVAQTVMAAIAQERR